MKSALGSLLLFAVFAVSSLRAQQPPELPRRALLEVGGAMSWGVAINGQAVGWELTRPHRFVTVSARLGNGGGHAYFDAFLMRAIGPDATWRDEVARTSLDLTYPADAWITLFENVELEAGQYWLVVAKPLEKAHSSINWIVARPMSLRSDCDVRYLGTKSYTFLTDAAEYIPASKFESQYEPYGFHIALTEGPGIDGSVCSQ